MYKFLCEYILSLLLGIYIGVDVVIWLLYVYHFEELLDFFLKVLCHFTFLQAIYEQFLYLLTNTCLYLFILILTILLSLKQCLIVVFICLSLWLMMLTIFPCAYWGYVFLSWRNAHLGSLPLFVLLLSCKCSLDILDTSSLSDRWFTNVFS